mmetsp:Transcript_21360/g.45300  ORF Transcript_21360/g.45300 Transcript_21360/m.45300 type:complete len:469 (-) Transcript_21360:11-1417(-)
MSRSITSSRTHRSHYESPGNGSPDSRYYDDYDRRRKFPDDDSLYRSRGRRVRNLRSFYEDLVVMPRHGVESSHERLRSTSHKSPYLKKSRPPPQQLVEDFDDEYPDVVSRVNTHVMDDIEDGIRSIVRNAYREQDRTISSLMDGLEADRREELERLKRRHEEQMKKVVMLVENEMKLVSQTQAQKNSLLEEKLAISQESVAKARDELKKVKDDAYALVSELKRDLELALADKDKLRRELEWKAQEYERKKLIDAQEMETLRNTALETAKSKNNEMVRLERELSKLRKSKDEILRNKNEEIRSLRSKIEVLEASNIEEAHITKANRDWEVSSGLTQQSDFDYPTVHAPSYNHSKHDHPTFKAPYRKYSEKMKAIMSTTTDHTPDDKMKGKLMRDDFANQLVCFMPLSKARGRDEKTCDARDDSEAHISSCDGRGGLEHGNKKLQPRSGLSSHYLMTRLSQKLEEKYLGY